MANNAHLSLSLAQSEQPVLSPVVGSTKRVRLRRDYGLEPCDLSRVLRERGVCFVDASCISEQAAARLEVSCSICVYVPFAIVRLAMIEIDSTFAVEDLTRRTLQVLADRLCKQLPSLKDVCGAK